MRNAFAKSAVSLVLAAAWLAGAGTENRAANYSQVGHCRGGAKTRDGIVTVKVEKRSSAGRKEVVGTGVVVDERGYVITNRHVVAGAERNPGRLRGRQRAGCPIQVEDDAHDLAILKYRPGNRSRP